MTDRTISYELPPVSPRQLPHDKVTLEFRVSADFAWEFLAYANNGDPFQLPDVNPGVMFYKLTLFDTAGAACKQPTEISKEAPYDPPSNLLNVTITDV